MNWRVLQTLFVKEMLETFRDRRTLFMMIGLPVLLYPSVLLIGAQVALLRQERIDKGVSRVYLETASLLDMPLIRPWLEASGKISVVYTIMPRAALRDGEIDLIATVKAPLSETFFARKPLAVELLYDVTEQRSLEALDRVDRLLKDVAEREQRRRLEERGIDPSEVMPLTVSRVDLAGSAKVAGSILGALLPALLIIITALGAFYPAVDLTAGEKERGTLETLLSTPVTRSELVTGKFLAVFCLAMLTAMVNLVAQLGTMYVFLGQVSETLPAAFSALLRNPLPLLAVILAIMVPMALLLSSLMMAVCLFARSFREAQTFLTPVMLLIAAPALIAGMPGLRLTPFWTFVPVVNAVLAFKEAMLGGVLPQDLFLVFASTLAVALFVLACAAWLFQREEITLADDPVLPLSWRRDAYPPRDFLSASHALGIFGGVMVLIFYVGSLLQAYWPLPGLLLTEWILVLAPVLGVLWLVRADFRAVLGWRPARLSAYVAAVFLGIGAFLATASFGALQERFLPIPEAYREAFQVFFTAGRDPVSYVWLFLVVALSPALCEEVLFRGVLLRGFAGRFPAWAAVLLVSFLFGLFHLSIFRFLPTALLGIPLAYIALRSGSVFPAMLAHALVNALALAFSLRIMPEPVSLWFFPAGPEVSQVSLGALILGAGLLPLGIALLEKGRRA
ncbi:MAG TPA: ABC transporter permease subunit/CPBP intramembrane protease [Candidatus Hydrogenedentes bacterium]|nr:ABC transporter permease subunit/CPBP intramembrane protease [Candidatus Hydrogenedentota bacterium]